MFILFFCLKIRLWSADVPVYRFGIPFVGGSFQR